MIHKKNKYCIISVPYVCLTDVVSVNLLAETEAWAVLSQLTQEKNAIMKASIFFTTIVK